jgi:hypothetical protein
MCRDHPYHPLQQSRRTNSIVRALMCVRMCVRVIQFGFEHLVITRIQQSILQLFYLVELHGHCLLVFLNNFLKLITRDLDLIVYHDMFLYLGLRYLLLHLLVIWVFSLTLQFLCPYIVHHQILLFPV